MDLTAATIPSTSWRGGDHALLWTAHFSMFKATGTGKMVTRKVYGLCFHKLSSRLGDKQSTNKLAHWQRELYTETRLSFETEGFHSESNQ
ncbi:hypothetical protein EVAR_71413_1 [Eumeta japonica]|uniref:Uncharacterized protein n=1 Tax=Eumeta variegata TaxID=151549 RepID=A0A4C1ST65_EUMVA|nr:hypothetical protein EVAR_71413_1 [Eumeta japonica]